MTCTLVIKDMPNGDTTNEQPNFEITIRAIGWYLDPRIELSLPAQYWLLAMLGTWTSVQHWGVHSSLSRDYESGSVMTRYLKLNVYYSLRRSSSLVHYALGASWFFVLVNYVRMTLIRLSERTNRKTSYRPISTEYWGSSSQVQTIISVLKPSDVAEAMRLFA